MLRLARSVAMDEVKVVVQRAVVELPQQHLEVLRRCSEVLGELEGKLFGTPLQLDVELAKFSIDRLIDRLERYRRA